MDEIEKKKKTKERYDSASFACSWSIRKLQANCLVAGKVP